MSQEFRPRQVLIRTSDMQRAVTFYRDVLGLSVSFQDGDRYVAFDAVPMSIALAAGAETSAPVTVAYRVLDVEAAAQELADGGATVVEPPSTTAHEHRATLADPTGGPISLYAPVQATSAQ